MYVIHEQVKPAKGESSNLGFQTIENTRDNIIFPADPANRHYAEYLRYTAWVDEGNNPEDFWTQEN